MSKTIRIAILGSCVTRDAFAFFPPADVEIALFIARTSFISLFSPPLPLHLDKSDIAAEHNFERNAIFADLFKTSLTRLAETEFDYLLLDFMEERHDLIRCDKTYILDTLPLRESGVVDRLPPFEGIERLAQATTKLWTAAAARFIAFLKEQGLAPDRIILHESAFARRYRLDGHGFDFAEFDAHSYPQIGALLADYHMIFRALNPGLRTITIEPDLLIGNGAHKWGRAPFHYIDAYYTRFLEKFRAIVGA